MVEPRQAFLGLFVADVFLFLLASLLDDHSQTSVDGILWWLAIALFVVLIAAACVVLVKFLFSRARRPRAQRARRQRPRA